MDENRLHEQVNQAVDHHCAHLTPDPFLTQKVLRAVQRKEIPVNSKMRTITVVAIVLMLLFTTALAAVILSGMEIVQETAVPMAIGNDEGQVRPNETFSAEELQELIRISAENGLIFDDSTAIMRAFRRGEGYSEEEAIMAICREAFGGLYYQWTVEQRHWFNEMMIAIGYRKDNPVLLPGPDDMPSEDARQLAREITWKHYGADIPLTDPAQYRLEEEYQVIERTADYTRTGWYFRFVPQNIRGSEYFAFVDGQGAYVEHDCETPDWDSYTERTLTNALTDLYSTSGLLYSMKQEGWVELGAMLPGATRSENWSTEFDAYLQTTYVLPDAADMQKSSLRALLEAQVGEKNVSGLYSTVLLAQDGRHVWRAAFHILDDAGNSQQYCYYEVDAKTGEILHQAVEAYARPRWAEFVPESVYQTLSSTQMSADEAIDLGIQALYQEYGDSTIPFRDESVFAITYMLSGDSRFYSIHFEPKVLGYGRSSIRLDCKTKQVEIFFANPMGLTADTLYDSYSDVYGPVSKWEQRMWVKFSEHLQSLTDAPTTFDAKLFRQTLYADDSQVKISKDRACDIAVLECGDTTTNIIYCMLIQAEPNPVWKLRLGSQPANSLYEIDAMTGEVLSKEWYFIQDSTIDHDMKMFTLRSVFMPAYLAEYGVERVAMEYAVKSDVGRYAYEGHEQFLDEEQYYVQTEGLTVTFAALTEKGVSYRVTVAEDGMRADVQVLSDVRELLKAAPKGSTAWAVGQYGPDRSQWPTEQQGSKQPIEISMTQEEAIAYAQAQLIAAVGQEAFDALGELYIDANMYRVNNDHEYHHWNVRFISKTSMEDNDSLLEGWRVYFCFRDGELMESAQIKDVNDKSNG